MTRPTVKAVYAELSRCLAPALEDAGLERIRGLSYPAWAVVVEGSGFVSYSLQVDKKATDPYLGGGFRVEVEKSSRATPALGINGQALFFQLMTAAEIREFLHEQNRVIQSYPTPPEEQILLYPEGPVREYYLKSFREQSAFDAIRCWLRYRSEADVRSWAQMLSPLVSSFVERAALYLDPDQCFLGKGRLLPDP